MAITDRSHIHKYIVMAIIDRPAVHGHMRSLTAISFTPVVIIINTPAYRIISNRGVRTTKSCQEPSQREAGCRNVHTHSQHMAHLRFGGGSKINFI